MNNTLHQDVRELRREMQGLREAVLDYHAALATEVALCGVCRAGVDRHERILVGRNGSSEGVVARVWALERFRRRISAALSALGAAVVALAAAWIGRR